MALYWPKRMDLPAERAETLATITVRIAPSSIRVPKLEKKKKKKKIARRKQHTLATVR